MNNYTDNFIFRIDNLEEFKADIDVLYPVFAKINPKVIFVLMY